MFLQNFRQSGRLTCHLVVWAVALFVGMSIPTTAKGQITNWVNTSGTPLPWVWDARNWSTNALPTTSSRTRFNTNATYDVWWNGQQVPRVAQVQTLNNSDVTFLSRTSGSRYRLQTNNLDMFGSSSITLRSMDLDVTGNALLRSNAAVIVDGSGSQDSLFGVSGTLRLDSGTISVSQGSDFEAGNLEMGESGPSYLNLDGQGSTATINGSLLTGKSQYGQVSVNNFAELNTTGITRVGGSSNRGRIDLFNNSIWQSSASVYVGSNGIGNLSAVSGSDVSTTGMYIGWNTNGNGSVVVEGSGSSITTSSFVVIGEAGTGSILVNDGGLFQVGTNLSIGAGFQAGGSGTVTVNQSGSHLDVSRDLYVGGSASGPGTGVLNITDSAKVSVGGQTRVFSGGTVNIDNGTFEFGRMTYTSFQDLNVASGTLAGTVRIAGYESAGGLTHMNNSAINVSGINIENAGTLYGGNNFLGSLNNTASGEIEVLAGERLRFAGSDNINSGEINNFGGTVRFDQTMANEATGFVTGRGQFIADGGWTNQGVIAISGGSTDVLGDVDNQSGGRIVTAGNSTTTFYDDVIHNGVEIHTALGSNTVFFGSQSGAGSFTGAGTVFYLGDLRPGNSPASVSYEGDVALGTSVETYIELAGLEQGDFDQLLIGGDLSLGGSLIVQLTDGFELSFNDQFLIAEVDGDLLGQFANLGEGDLVGNFGGHDLFISYTAGDGNDVGLFTAVPEPSSIGLLACSSLLLLVRRRSS